MKLLRPALLAWAALAGTAVLLLMPLPESWHDGWQGELLDLGHVPLFAVLALAFALALRSLLWSALLAATVAGLAEIIQPHVGRTGDIDDFLRGCVGVGVTVAVLHWWRGPRTAGRTAGHLLAIAVLLAWPIAQGVERVGNAYEGHRSFPTLVNFCWPWQMRRWEVDQAELTREENPANPGAWVGKLEFLPGPADYPGAALHPVVHDWTGYQRLCVDFVVEGEPLYLVVSLRTGRGDAGHYQLGREYGAGPQFVAVDLAQAVAEAAPPLDLGDVRAVQLFLEHPDRRRTIRLRRIWLE